MKIFHQNIQFVEIVFSILGKLTFTLAGWIFIVASKIVIFHQFIMCYHVIVLQELEDLEM